MKSLIILFFFIYLNSSAQVSDTIAAPSVLFNLEGDKALHMSRLTRFGISSEDSVLFRVYGLDKPKPIDSVIVCMDSFPLSISICPKSFLEKYRFNQPGVAFIINEFHKMHVSIEVIDINKTLRYADSSGKYYSDYSIIYSLYLDDRHLVSDSVNRINPDGGLSEFQFSSSIRPYGVIWKHPMHDIYFLECSYVKQEAIADNSNILLHSYASERFDNVILRLVDLEKK